MAKFPPFSHSETLAPQLFITPTPATGRVPRFFLLLHRLTRATHGFPLLSCRSSRSSRQYTRSVQDAHLHLWIRQVLSQHGPLEEVGRRGCQGLPAAVRDLVPHGEYGAGGVVSTAQPQRARLCQLTINSPCAHQVSCCCDSLHSRVQPTLLLSPHTCALHATPYYYEYIPPLRPRFTSGASRRCSRLRTR